VGAAPRPPPTALPPAFVSACQVAPAMQLELQAALQRHVDNAISKTVNVSPECGFAAFRGVYERAHALGLKGCAAFRPNPTTGEVLVAERGPGV
jgi:ribonucleoside-diphosphate reductase alpha chain